jgi:hypothetical protein
MNKRYLEIDSSYRNRKQFPKPSRFEVLISQTGTRGRFQAYDPVSKAATITVWSPSTILNVGTVQANTANTNSRFLVCFPQPTNRDIHYYRGLVIDVGGTLTMINNMDYESTNSASEDCYWVRVETSLVGTPAAGTLVTPQVTFDNTSGVFWVPNTVLAENFYVGCIIWNDTLQEGANIVSYDGKTHTIGVDITNNPQVSTWILTQQYNIRALAPGQFGNLAVPVPPQINTVNKIALPLGSSSIENFYVGSFIRITSGTNAGTVCRITSYTGDGNTTAVPPVAPRMATIDCLLQTPILGGEQYEINQFTRDNVVPFVYTGSLVSQQEMVCYEIELITLVLPNRILVSGGRSSFYPYVYVELQNVSGSSAGNSNIIYSNNPNATRMLFRASIDDIPNPLVSPFIKIDGDGMVQTIKFKPNDSFKFGVYLPNGQEFDTITPETFSPQSPNPLIQISAVFSMKRL